MYNELNNYNSFQVPDHWRKIKIECEYLSPSVKSQKEIVVIALGKSIATLSIKSSQGIPKYPNPRGLNINQKVYKDMVDTLMHEPQIFKERNHGAKISAFVQDISYTEQGTSIITLRFAPPGKDTIGQGIHDGQHSLHSFVTAKMNKANLSEARVRLLLLNGYLPTIEDGQNTIAWQTSYKHDNRTKYNAQGRFDELKDWIPPNWTVSYYQNQLDIPDSSRCSIDHIMQLLAVLDTEKFDWLNPKFNRHPINVATNLGRNYDGIWESACKLAHLVTDVVAIEQSIIECIIKDQKRNQYTLPGFAFPVPGEEHNFSGKTILPNRQVYQLTASRGFVWPIVSAFRILLDKDESLGKLEWQIDIDKNKDALVKILWGHTKSALTDKADNGVKNAIGNLVTDVEFWHCLCGVAKKFKDSKIVKPAQHLKIAV